MYRENDLQDGLFGLVGFHQTDNPDLPQLAEYLTQSSSGLYFQDEQPLIHIENIDAALKNYSRYNFPLYSPGTEYPKFARVKTVDLKVWESLVDDNQGNTPDASPGSWKEVSLLSQKLESLVRAAINKLTSRVFEDKKIDGIVKSIFERVHLFDGAGDLLNKEIKSGRFVGYQIAVSDERDLTTFIRRIGTQFSQANASFHLYVFHSSQMEPVKIYTLNLSKSNSFEWTDTSDDGFYLRYDSPTHSPGGVYYVGYYEDDLNGQAINRGYDFGVAPTCSTCNQSYYYWTQWSKFLEVIPIAVPAEYLVGLTPGYDETGAVVTMPQLWDVNVIQYLYTKSFGLNLDLTVGCDVTETMIAQKRVFTTALIKQVTVDLLKEMAYSTRNNPISKEVQNMALYALKNQDNYTPGAESKLDKSLKALSFDLSDFNEACLPCNRANGITWGSV